MVAWLLGAPAVGEKDVMVGDGVTVNVAALVAVSQPALTLKVPVSFHWLSRTRIWVAVLLRIWTGELFNVTEFTPVKLLPKIVTSLPTGPDVGEKLVMTGAGTPLTRAGLATTAPKASNPNKATLARTRYLCMWPPCSPRPFLGHITEDCVDIEADAPLPLD